MKLSDMPTPETDACEKRCRDNLPFALASRNPIKSIGDVVTAAHARMLEQRLALAVAENARLKAALDRYSEDEMLCNDTIEQPADLRQALNRAAYALFQIKRMVPEEIPKFAADEHSAACAVLDCEQPFKRSK